MRASNHIQGGKSPRDLPLLACRMPARIVRVPAETVRSWVFKRAYATRSGDRRWPALVKATDREGRRLSFTNFVELHVLSGKKVRVEHIRSATRFIISEQMATELRSPMSTPRPTV